MVRPGRRIALRLLACCVCVFAATMGAAAPAQAGHNTCEMQIYTPYKGTWSDSTVRFIDFEAFVDCAWGTNGRFFHEAQRHRWWGWQQLFDQDAALNDRGNRRLGVRLDCPGPTITEGTWTFRSLATVSVSHWSGFDGFTGVGGEYRTGCYD